MRNRRLAPSDASRDRRLRPLLEPRPATLWTGTSLASVFGYRVRSNGVTPHQKRRFTGSRTTRQATERRCLTRVIGPNQVRAQGGLPRRSVLGGTGVICIATPRPKSASISRGLFSPVAALSDLDPLPLVQRVRNGCARNPYAPRVSSDRRGSCQKCCALDASLSERRSVAKASGDLR